MGKHKSLDELKDEFIGKTFNYLTVIDVENYYIFKNIKVYTCGYSYTNN